MQNVIQIGPRLSTEQDRERQRQRMLADVLSPSNYGGQYGGLRSAGESIAKAFMYKNQEEKTAQQDQERRDALSKVLGGATAKPWVDPDTGKVSDASAGGIDGMLAALSNNPNAMLAETLAPQLITAKMNREQSEQDRLRGIEDQKDMFAWKQENTLPEDARDYEFAKQNGFQGTYVDWKQVGGGGQETFGNSPIWSTDAQGNPVLVQVSNRGNAKAVDLPEGVTPQRGQTKTVDLGDKIGVLDANGMLIGYQAKGLGPERYKDDNRIITVPAMAGGQTPIPQGGPSIQQAGGMPQPAAAMPGTEAAAPGGVQTVSLPPSQEDMQKKMDAFRSFKDIAGGMSDTIGQMVQTGPDGKVIGTHPGLSDMVGAKGYGGLGALLPFGDGEPFQGTDASNFKTIFDKLGGEAFLKSRERLKGTGVITDFESQEAKAAELGLSLAQTEEEFIKAAINYRDTNMKLIDLAEKRLNGQLPMPGQQSGGQPQQPPGTVPASGPAPAGNPDLYKKYDLIR